MKEHLLEYNTWEDVVFENRNKQYGAYLLRKVYNSSILLAACLSIFIYLSLITIPFLIQWMKGKIEQQNIENIISSSALTTPPSIEKEIIIKLPASNLSSPVQKTIKFVPPKVTDKQIFQPEDFPSINDMKNSQIGDDNKKGTDSIFTNNTGDIIGDGKNNSDPVLFAEQMPEFPGGQQELMKYIANHIKYPESARRMGVEGTVYISFVINKEGKINDIFIMKGISKDCDEEATRVIGTLPDWKPGKQNGQPISVRFSLPIRFKLTN